MDYKTLSEYVKKYKLKDYISLLKGHTSYDKHYSIFYLEKCKFFWRMMNGFSKKYTVFMNYDLEYGKKKNVVFFYNIDDASNYLWDMFSDYVFLNDDFECLRIRKIITHLGQKP